MGMVMAGGVAVLVVIIAWLYCRRRRDESPRTHDGIFGASGSCPELIAVRLGEFPCLDPSYYENARVELEREGFHFLADLAAANACAGGERRTVFRFMSSADHTILAVVCQVHVPWALRWPPRLSGTSPEFLWFAVEARDGRFYRFFRTDLPLGDPPALPPEMIGEWLSGGYGPAEVCGRFRRAFMKFRAAHPDFLPLPLPTVAEAVASRRRMHDLCVRFRPTEPSDPVDPVPETILPASCLSGRPLIVSIDDLRRAYEKKRR